MNIDTDNIIITDTVPADSLEPGDQIVVDNEYFIIHSIDSDRDDIDEILVKGENLSDIGNNEISLYADDYFDLWSI